MDQPSADRMLRELDRFVGEWTMPATPPGGPPHASEGAAGHGAGVAVSQAMGRQLYQHAPSRTRTCR